MSELIYGQIVKILSDTQIIIDKGELDSVQEGMTFIIYDEGEQIQGREGEELGPREIRKGVLKVKQTMPKMSVLETTEKLVRRKSSLDEARSQLASILRPMQEYQVERVQEKLNIGELGALGKLLYQKGPVAVGDKVRSLINP